MRSVVAALLDNAAADPDRIAAYLYLDAATHQLTRRGLLDLGLGWTAAYRRLGLEPGDIVIVMMGFGPAMLAAYLGAMLGGFVPSYMPYSAARQDRELFMQSHRRLFERIGAKVVATDSAWLAANAEIFEASGTQPVLAEDVAAAGAAVNEPPFEAKAEAIALLQHSSGTTALKKGVALSHRAVLNQARSYARAISLGEPDLIASWLPLYHDMGLMACFVIPLVMGVPVAQMDPFVWAREPWRLFDMIGERGATLVWLPNFAYHHLVRTVDPAGRYDLSSVRGFIDCSEPCKPNTMRAFLEAFAGKGVQPQALQACYAMAENGFAVAQTPLGQPPRYLVVDAEVMAAERRCRPASPGRPSLEFMSNGLVIEGVELKIVDDDRRELSEGAIGEIAIAGDCLFSGYFKLPEETAAVLHSGWCHTGDLGFLHDGHLYVTGRKKDLIIVRGRNFYAHDIEYVVSASEGVKPGRAVAFGLFREESGTEEAVVVAETSDPARLDPREQLRRGVLIKQQVKDVLDLELHTVRLVPPGWLIKTTSGKISRAQNREKYLDAESKRGLIGVA